MRRGPILLALLALVGCHDLQVYAFVGERYDEVEQCLLPRSTIDVIEGVAEGKCDGVRCFEGADGTVYVSGQCHAPPGYVDQTANEHSRQCRLALEAYDLGSDGACPSA